jgi:hypothetical protein
MWRLALRTPSSEQHAQRPDKRHRERDDATELENEITLQACQLGPELGHVPVQLGLAFHPLACQLGPELGHVPLQLGPELHRVPLQCMIEIGSRDQLRTVRLVAPLELARDRLGLPLGHAGIAQLVRDLEGVDHVGHGMTLAGAPAIGQ